MRFVPVIVTVAAVISTAAGARALTVTVTPSDDLHAAAASLEPGDTLLLSPGEYVLGGTLTLSGSGDLGQPITVRNASDRPLLRTTGPFAALTITGDRLTIEGLEIAGPGPSIVVDGAQNVDLRGLDIDGGSIGGYVVLGRPGGTFGALTIRNSRVYDTGSSQPAVTVGCLDGSCNAAGVVLENVSLEQLGGAGIVISGWAADVRVADSVVDGAAGASVDVRAAQNAGAGPTVIERNLLWRGAIGVRVGPGAVVRNNLILGMSTAGIDVLTSATGELQVGHNTVHGSAVALRLGAELSGDAFIANNALYAGQSGGVAIQVPGTTPTGGTLAGNVVVGPSDLATGWTAGRSDVQDFVDPGGNDFFPSADSPLIDGGAALSIASDDFNGDPRDASPDVGAYERPEGRASNPAAPPPRDGGFKWEFEWSFDPPGWSWNDGGTPDRGPEAVDEGPNEADDTPTSSSCARATCNSCSGCSCTSPCCDNACESFRTGSCSDGGCCFCEGTDCADKCQGGPPVGFDPSFPALVGAWLVFVWRRRRS